jgi:hypothetical protein
MMRADPDERDRVAAGHEIQEKIDGKEDRGRA